MLIPQTSARKNLTLTLILNTNYECPKAYIRLLQLFDIKLMEKNTKITCSSLLHNELWYIFEENQWPSKPRSRDTQIQFPKLESWKFVFYYASSSQRHQIYACNT